MNIFPHLIFLISLLMCQPLIFSYSHLCSVSTKSHGPELLWARIYMSFKT